MLDVCDIVGKFGLYHLAVMMLCVLRAFPSSWTLVLTPFIVLDVDHWCSKEDGFQNITSQLWKELAVPFSNETGKYESCQRYDLKGIAVDRTQTVPCESWEFNETIPGASAVVDWNLVCQNDWLRSAMQSTAFLGSIAGALTIGKLSDRFGRRFMFFVCSFLILITGSCASLSPTVIWYNVFRFFMAMSVAGVQITSAALFMEIVLPKHRTFLGVGFSIGFALSTTALPGVAYLLGNWRHLQLVSGLSALLVIPLIFIIQESPRWLMTRMRNGDARKSIEKILTINRQPIPDMSELMPKLIAKTKMELESESYGLLEVLKYPTLRKNMLCLFFVWFCDSFFAYGATLTSVSLGGNPYINYAISAAAEIPGGLVGLIVARYSRRRVSLPVLQLIPSLASILIAAVPKDLVWLRLVLNMICRFCLVMSSLVKWILTMEIFPTVARGFGFSCCFMFGRIGGAVVPFLRDLGNATHEAVPFAVMGILGIMSAGVTLLVSETLNKPLPDTYHESNKLGRASYEMTDGKHDKEKATERLNS